MPGRRIALGALFTVTAIVVGAGTVANLVMPPPSQDRAVALAPPGESAKPIAAASVSETAKRPTNGATSETSSRQPKPVAEPAKAASAPAAAPQPEKPASARLTVNEAAAPAKQAEAPASPPQATAPVADSAFPPMQPLEAPATAAVPKPVQQATQPPSPAASAAGAAGEKPAAKKRVADDRRPKASVRPEPYAMRDFLRSHW